MDKTRDAGVSIVIPVYNRLEFTRVCLDRVARHTTDVPHEVIIVDNGSTDDTAGHFRAPGGPPELSYHRNNLNLGFAGGNNVGARLAKYEHLLFLNNDTLPQPGWLSAMMNVARADARVGIVGIKQLFPYTSRVYHSGIAFTRGPRPVHLYPYADARAVHVNKQREYQAVNGACLLISAELFAECGGFDEGYINGYEDVDLCLAARQRKFKVVCCTQAHIYHYAQISEGRTADDEQNLARLVRKWGRAVQVDEDDYYREDAVDVARSAPAAAVGPSPAQSGGSGENSSPYWLGTRVSVVLPTAGRTETLVAQLAALGRQSVLAQEFEVLVVDYKGDNTEGGLSARQVSFAARYCACTGESRPGAACNVAVDHARGELVLFLGEGCVPDDRLLEEHLHTHAWAADPGVAVIGVVEDRMGRVRGNDDRALSPTRGRVASPSSCPSLGSRDLPQIDLANASFKRTFLWEAWKSGVRINVDLASTSFQGAELGMRLGPLGLRTLFAPTARVHRNTVGPLESLAARDLDAGRDAVAVFRSHPALDPALDVRWIAETKEDAGRLAERPSLQQALAQFDRRSDELIRSLVEKLVELTESQGSGADGPAMGIDDRSLVEAREATVALTRDIARTRGKVRAWYEIGPDSHLAAAAEPLAAVVRKIDWLAIPSARRVSESRGTNPARGDSARNTERISSARRTDTFATARIRRIVIITASRTRMKSRLRVVDRFIEGRLMLQPRWLARYKALRSRLRPYFV